MTGDPYAMLGVTRDADAETIRRAGRLVAAKAHPDAGGNAEDFNRVQAARDLLGDPDAKARYDSDGTWPKEKQADNRQAMIYEEATQRFLKLAAAENAARVDLLKEIRAEIDGEVRALRQNIADRRASARKLRKLARRITRKPAKIVDGEAVGPPPPNALKRLIRTQAEGVVANVPQIEDRIRFLSELKTFFAEHEYEVEKEETPAVMVNGVAFREVSPRGGFWRTTTS